MIITGLSGNTCRILYGSIVYMVRFMNTDITLKILWHHRHWVCLWLSKVWRLILCNSICFKLIIQRFWRCNCIFAHSAIIKQWHPCGNIARIIHTSSNLTTIIVIQIAKPTSFRQVNIRVSTSQERNGAATSDRQLNYKHLTISHGGSDSISQNAITSICVYRPHSKAC